MYNEAPLYMNTKTVFKVGGGFLQVAPNTFREVQEKHLIWSNRKDLDKQLVWILQNQKLMNDNLKVFDATYIYYIKWELLSYFGSVVEHLLDQVTILIP